MQLGALDIEPQENGLAAILPDSVPADALGLKGVTASPAIPRDNGSVWLVNPRTVHIGNFLIAPAGIAASPGALRLTDSSAFGTGHHPTTALCIEAIDEALSVLSPNSLLDVGTGSGVLALTALMKGVPHAVGLDIDGDALKIALEHARMNNLVDRLQLVLGGPEAVSGTWPLVVANVLAAPLMEIAPVLARRVRSRGRLILSGIPQALESDVRRAYERVGMRYVRSEMRGGWIVLVVETSW